MTAPTYAFDNLQSVDGTAIVQNSTILEGIENAIEDASNSQSGYAQDVETGIIGSADGHAVVANHGQNVWYQAATGAINESYADIIGNLLKLIKKKEGTYAGNVNFERWLIGEFLGDDTEHVIRDMSNPMNNGQGKYPSPAKINDQYFVKDTGV